MGRLERKLDPELIAKTLARIERRKKGYPEPKPHQRVKNSYGPRHASTYRAARRNALRGKGRS